MLQVRGKVLDVKHETVRPEGRAEFTTTEVAVMTGKADIERVRLAYEFQGPTPVEGAEVDLSVVISLFSTRNGPGCRLTALENLAAVERPKVAAG